MREWITEKSLSLKIFEFSGVCGSKTLILENRVKIPKNTFFQQNLTVCNTDNGNESKTIQQNRTMQLNRVKVKLENNRTETKQSESET